MEDGRKEDVEGRRGFLQAAFWGALALLGAAAGVVAGGFLYPLRRRRPEPLFVCLETEVRAEQPKLVRDPRGRNVLLLRDAAGRFKAVGTVCSHLGCTVFYRPRSNRFECPCHAGVFDGEGNPVSGPPQRPLERFPVEVRQGKVFIRFS